MLDANQRSQLLRFDTCKIANAIEKLGLRLRNEGFTSPGLSCQSGRQARALGYAVTSRVKCADPPMKGYSYYDLADWWDRIRSRPEPRIAVIEDVDETPGQGAVLSDVHAEVLCALNCHAVITNGAVRDIGALARQPIAVFSRYVGMSHAYVHMTEFGIPVEILGLRVAPEDLLYVDVHGALEIPEPHVDEIIELATEQARRERIVIDLCRARPFSFAVLRAAVRSL